MAYIFGIISTAMKEKKRKGEEKEKNERDERRRGRGSSRMQEEETREGARRKPKETHAVKARATTI